MQHPEIAQFIAIEFLMFTDQVDPAKNILRNATIMPPGRVDRSPCGTGSAARLALMHAKGQARVGDVYDMRSTKSSSFDASIIGEPTVGALPAMLLRIAGGAWVYATMQ